MTTTDGKTIVMVERPQLGSPAKARADLIVCKVLKVLLMAATEQEDGNGYVMATHATIAAYTGLTVKQVRRALDKLVFFHYADVKRGPRGQAFCLYDFSTWRQRFGIIDDPEIVAAAPENSIPIYQNQNTGTAYASMAGSFN